MMKIQKPDPETAACGTCRYYQEYEDLEPDDIESDEDLLTGICRRYPPVVFPGLSPTSTCPDVSASTGWCGEYMPKV